MAWEYCKTNPTIGATLPEQRSKERDTGFFSKIGAAESSEEADGETVELLKKLIRQHPELVTELLKESAGSQ